MYKEIVALLSICFKDKFVKVGLYFHFVHHTVTPMIKETPNNGHNKINPLQRQALFVTDLLMVLIQLCLSQHVSYFEVPHVVFFSVFLGINIYSLGIYAISSLGVHLIVYAVV